MSLIVGIAPDLAWAAAWVFLFGFLVASRDLPLRYALIVAGLKVSIPVLYFGLNPTGFLHLSDDVNYFQTAVTLFGMGLNPVSVFLDPRGFATLAGAAGTTWHVAYPLWNLVAVNLFGPHYFSPVLMNVGATFVSGFFFFRILRQAGFSTPYSQAALAFFLLHWDTLAWSSFLNLKDTLVVTFVLAVLHQCMAFLRAPRFWRIIPIALFAAGLFYVRFYGPLILLATLLVYLVLTRKGRWRIVSGIILTLSLPLVYANWGRFVGTFHPGEFFWGLPQFLLTPLPWNLSPGYEFLLLPAALHVLLILPALLAIPSLWRRAGEARILIVYLVLVLLIFSVLPEYRGIRQRQMTGFVFIWMQFHALRAFARYALATGSRKSRTEVSN